MSKCDLCTYCDVTYNSHTTSHICRHPFDYTFDDSHFTEFCTGFTPQGRPWYLTPVPDVDLGEAWEAHKQRMEEKRNQYWRELLETTTDRRVLKHILDDFNDCMYEWSMAGIPQENLKIDKKVFDRLDKLGYDISNLTT